MQNNQIIKDDSSSRDQYYNDHVACIVFGNNESYLQNEQLAKKIGKKTVDEFVGQDFLFGKYLNFEVSEKEWQNQLAELQKQLSNNNPKFANLKGIKFFLHEHGSDGKNRSLSGIFNAKPKYYKSKRFQDVAKIINDNFLSKSNENKLYFNNIACYGAYNFNERNKKNDSDTHNNNGFWSNNIYEILSNEFGSNRDKVYCSQLIPQSGINTASTMNLNNNPYRNGIYFSSQIGHLVREGEKYHYDSGLHDFRKKYFFEYNKLSTKDLIPSPECKIYFPLKEFRNVVPNYHTKPINKTTNNEQPYIKQEKYYKVDDKILEYYTGEEAKSRKNNFFKWGEQPKYGKFDEKLPFDIYGVKYNNLSECVKKNLYDYYQQCNEQFKQSHEKNQAIIEQYDSQLLNSNSNNPANDCSIF